MHASAVPPIRAGSKTASRETGRNPYRNIRPKHEPDHLTPLVQIVKLNGKKTLSSIHEFRQYPLIGN